MKRGILLALLLLLAWSLFAETEGDMRILMKATFEEQGIRRYYTGLGINAGKYCYVSANMLGFTRIQHDPYNHGKYNFSLTPMTGMLMFSGVGSLMEAIDEKNIAKGDSTHWFYLSLPFLAPIAGNSQVFFPLIPILHNSGADIPQRAYPDVALFVKNDTDLFIGRKNLWGKVSPGGGMGVYIHIPSQYSFEEYGEIGAEVGVQRTFQTNFKGNQHAYNDYFLRAVINLSIIPGMQ